MFASNRVNGENTSWLALRRRRERGGVTSTSIVVVDLGGSLVWGLDRADGLDNPSPRRQDSRKALWMDVVVDCSCFCWLGKCSVWLVSGLTERAENPRAKGAKSGISVVWWYVLLYFCMKVWLEGCR